MGWDVVEGGGEMGEKRKEIRRFRAGRTYELGGGRFRNRSCPALPLPDRRSSELLVLKKCLSMDSQGSGRGGKG